MTDRHHLATAMRAVSQAHATGAHHNTRRADERRLRIVASECETRYGDADPTNGRPTGFNRCPAGIPSTSAWPRLRRIFGSCRMKDPTHDPHPLGTDSGRVRVGVLGAAVKIISDRHYAYFMACLRLHAIASAMGLAPVGSDYALEQIAGAVSDCDAAFSALDGPESDPELELAELSAERVRRCDENH